MKILFLGFAKIKIMPYINFGPGPRFKEGTPKEILEAQEKLTQLSIQQTLDSAI